MKKFLLRRPAMGLLAALAALSLLAAACSPEGTASKPAATAAKSGQAAGKPLLSAIPDAPPRATPTPLPPGATPPPPPQPPAVKTVPLYAYLDAVTSGNGESKYKVDASTSCVKTSAFARGMQITFRMELVDTSTGKILQGADVDKAVLTLPNGETVNYRYGRHGPTQDSPWFFTAAWSIPTDFPLGKLDYKINVTTKSGKTATFGEPLQVGDSPLTIVAGPADKA